MSLSSLKYLLLVGLFMAGFFPLDATGRRDDSHPRLSLEVSIEKRKAVEGERVIYEVNLISDTSEIAGCELLQYPDFSGLPVAQAAGDSHLKKIERKGETLYSVVIDRYFIGAEETGNFTFKGGDYRIGINHPVAVDDPFWGPSVVNRMKAFNLTAPDVSFSVSPVPTRGKPEIFSGAIGEYEISANLPQKTIGVDEQGLLTITIVGKGDLTNSPAPDVRGAFGEGLAFRSMTDDKQQFIANGSLGSEMRLDCVFTADALGTYTILPLSFCFYDPERKRYVTVTTSAVEVEVVPSKIKEGVPPVFHSI